MITNFKIFEKDKYNFEIEEESKKIIESYDPVVVKYEDNVGYFSVLLKDKNSNFETWLDIDIRDYEIYPEWNQIQYNINNSNDMIKRKVEGDTNVWDLSTSIAEKKLLDDSMIYYENDKYYHYKDFWYIKDGYKDSGIPYEKAKDMKKYNV